MSRLAGLLLVSLPRLVGVFSGSPVPAEEASAQAVVALWGKAGTAASEVRCSGVFIAPEVVLTAASCLLAEKPATLVEHAACAAGASSCPTLPADAFEVLSAAKLPEEQELIAVVLAFEFRYSVPQEMPQVCTGGSICGEGWDVAALRVEQLCPRSAAFRRCPYRWARSAPVRRCAWLVLVPTQRRRLPVRPFASAPAWSAEGGDVEPVANAARRRMGASSATPGRPRAPATPARPSRLTAADDDGLWDRRRDVGRPRAPPADGRVRDRDGWDAGWHPRRRRGRCVAGRGERRRRRWASSGSIRGRRPARARQVERRGIRRSRMADARGALSLWRVLGLWGVVLPVEAPA